MTNLDRGRGWVRAGIALAFVLALGAGWFLGRAGLGVDHAGHGKTGAAYYCPMHPQIQQDQPGQCPVCFMDLVAKGAPDRMTGGEGETLPESLKGLAPVHLSPWKQQLIGVRLEAASRRPVKRLIRTVGRFGGGGFAAAASDFAATGVSGGGGGRYVVADVYALDIPFLKRGQRAWVSPFSGSGEKASGRVAAVYPYDETQSRITRVRIDLDRPAGREIYANVEIESDAGPRLSVPPEAVLDSGIARYVFLEGQPGYFTPREVTVGFKGEDLWEVASGLKEGDRVVVGANFLMDADSKLKAVLSGMAAASDEHKH
jgi:hypothetical protein